MLRQQIPLMGKCLDFFHLRDNIQKTRREIFGTLEDGDKAGRTGAHDLAEMFQTLGFTAGFDSLVTFRKTLRSPPRKPAVTRLVNDISDRRALITSPEFRAAGRGSGPTEAQCQCETLRLKGYGCRWNKDNALAISPTAAASPKPRHREVLEPRVPLTLTPAINFGHTRACRSCSIALTLAGEVCFTSPPLAGQLRFGHRSSVGRAMLS